MSELTLKLANGARYLRERGPINLLRELRFRATNALCDRWYGVDTVGGELPSELGFQNTEWHGYDAQGYRELRDTFRRLPFRPEEISFLDIGSGKARPGVVAAALGCRRVINVELAQSLHDVAVRNFADMRGRKTEDVECICQDATTYVIPTDVNVIFIANSFVGATLDQVIQRICHSYEANPRPLCLVYFNHKHFDEARAAKGLHWFQKLHGDLVWYRYSRAFYRVGDWRAPAMLVNG